MKRRETTGRESVADWSTTDCRPIQPTVASPNPKKAVAVPSARTMKSPNDIDVADVVPTKAR